MQASETLETLETEKATGDAGESTKDGHGAAAGTVVLRFDEAASYGSLSLRLLDLEDSRCPLGAQCIWEGQAAATIEVRSADGAGEAGESGAATNPETVELVLRAGRDPGKAVVEGHELWLSRVEPYPREGETREREAQVVTLEVRAL